MFLGGSACFALWHGHDKQNMPALPLSYKHFCLCTFCMHTPPSPALPSLRQTTILPLLILLLSLQDGQTLLWAIKIKQIHPSSFLPMGLETGTGQAWTWGGRRPMASLPILL